MAAFVVGSVGLSVLTHERMEKPARAWIRDRWTRRGTEQPAAGLQPRA
nr:hypothetical protein [Corallococcus coralloides]